MEKAEMFLSTSLASRHIWKILSVTWLFTSGTPADRTNYGLLN